MAYVVTEQPISKGADVPLMAAMTETLQDSPSLQALLHADYIRVAQTIVKCELCSGCEHENRYKISNAQGVLLYKAHEQSCCCFRQCCGSNRGFTMEIRDPEGRDAIKFERNCQCQCSCCPCCCLQKLEVYLPSGRFAGAVEQNLNCVRPEFTILDENREPHIKIEGPCQNCTCCNSCWNKYCCCCMCCRSVGYQITQNGEQIGLLRKEYSSAAKETMTDYDNFYVTFPPGLSISTKATLIGAVFLIDFMFFEG